MWLIRIDLSSWEIIRMTDPDWMYFEALQALDGTPLAAIMEIYVMRRLTLSDFERK